ncbi:MAG: InlB B-repeat-containing protein [Fibrobacter sp.]|nr:InlB B-repeat-containing protein [Fibrobacter sp.]
MMRNGINSYLTTLVMVLALLFSANAFAATEQSPISIEGKDYTLFTGFTATDGSITNTRYTYSNVVDGDPSTRWRDIEPASGFSYVEFRSDVPIFLKGYKLNSYDESEFHPSEWRLFAKADEDDDYVLVSEYIDQTYSGTEHNYPVVNEVNNQYRFFRFECTEEDRNIGLTEIRLYGYNVTYTHLTPQSATCTQQGVLRECYLRGDGKYFEDENGEIGLDVDECVTAMLAHVTEHHEADANHIEYWQCSVCGKFFLDADLTTEIIEAETQVVSYLNSDGNMVRLMEDATKVTSSMTTWDEGWYVVYEDVTVDDRITVNGEVHLILANGKTLNANKGITVATTASFNVYAQTEDEMNMGTLNASSPNSLTPYAGIGCAYGSGDAGSITINGGKITARGNLGAGIGSVQFRSVGSITINGGIVDAADAKGSGAGIGSGQSGKASAVNLNGGVIYAKGIGAGQSGTGSITINISNGIKKIVATSNNSGCIGNKENITVNFKNEGSIVTGVAKDEIFDDSGEGEWRIIRTKALNHHTVIDDDIKAHITVNPEYALAGELITLTLGVAVDASSVKINGGAVSLSDVGEGTYTFVMPDGDVNVAAEVAETYSVDFPEHMEIIRTSNPADGDGKYISGTVVEFRPLFPYTATDVSDGTNMLVASNSVYGVTIGTSNINISATINRESFINLSEATNNFTAVDGDVLSGTTQYTVMVADKANISLSGATINGGIICDGSASITLVGENNVTGAYQKAGIQVGGLGSTLTIRGEGSLTVSGNHNSAGIGLSQAWNVDAIGGDIVIEGGNITAIGYSRWGSGIGTGVIISEVTSKTARLGNITIKGGSVKAVGGTEANGIGTGYTYYGSKNEIGTVTIYDDVDVVDASSIKNGESIIYMHDDIDVSVSKNDYFGIIENGERKIIYTGIPAFDVEDQTYTGETITPKPTVSLGSLNFTEGTDYEYSYSNNINVGTATVTVTFKGDYAEFGSVSKSFNITKATPTVEPPTSANPKYAGACVALVASGSSNSGDMLYSVLMEGGSQTAYSTDIPCADAAGNYTVYYKVEENDNWFGVEEQSVDVTVELAKFKVTYVDEDGSEISSTDYQYGTPTTLLVPTREGYAFVGWYKSADFFGEAVASIADDATGALTFYAKWQELPTLVNKGTVSECFEISSVNQLYSFAALVNGVITASQLPSGYPVGSNICGKLANEIVVNENVLDDEGKLNTVTEGGFRTWTPIGNSSKQYTGTFDGQGFAIKGLYFNEGSKDSVGLFGYVGSDGKVENVGVEDSYIRGLNVVGGVAGYNQGSIANSYNSSSVAGGDNYVGGVAGINVGSIANSYNSGSVTGGDIFVGSVTGINDGSIKNCFAKSGSPVGLVSPAGVAFRDETEFHDGTVAILLHNGTNGYVWGQNVGTDAYPVLSNTYDAEGNLQPGVVKFNLEYVLNEGSNAANAASTHSYGTETELPIPTREGYAFAGWYENEDFSGDAVKTIVAAAQISATAQTVGENTIWTKKYYAKWSFAYTITYELNGKDAINSDVDNSANPSVYLEGVELSLAIPTREGYGFVGWYNSADFSGEPVSSIAADASGAKTFYARWQEIPVLAGNQCYEISNVEQLYGFAALVNGTVSVPADMPSGVSICGRLTKNIYVNGSATNPLQSQLVKDADGNVTNGTSFRTWTLIGNRSKQYTGTFDGQGFAIKGLYFNDESEENVGLFGYVGSDGKVENVGVEDSYFRGQNYVGGVTGFNEGSVTNCYNSGSVNTTGEYSNVGGVTGSNEGSVTNCYNSGSVNTTGEYSYVGGVIGFNCGSVTNSFAKTGSAEKLIALVYGDSFGSGFKTGEEFSNGTVAALLHNGIDGSVWGQNLADEISYPDFSGKIEFNYGSIVIAADKSKATILGNSTETANVPNPVEVNSVEFERTFVASPEGLNIANTIVLPFSTNEGTTANADFYAFTGVTVEDGVYTAEFRTEVKVAALEAGVPYAVILKEEATNLNMTLGSPVSVQTAELNNPKVGDWEFSGSYANRYWENGCTALECVYGFAAADDVDGIYKAGDFVKGGSDVSVKPMRAVLSRTSDQSNSGNGMLRAPAYRGVSRAIAEDVPEVIAVLFGNADGEVTFVGQMNTRTGNITLEKADRWFDMKGRRLNGKPTVKGTYYNNGKKVIIK